MASNTAYKLICRTLTVAIISSASIAMAAEAETPKTDITKLDIDAGKLENKYARDPAFSPDSADQKARDKVIEANGAEFEKMTSGHIEALYKCQHSKDEKTLKACREQAFKK